MNINELKKCLNPCSNGRYSLSLATTSLLITICLNPCSNGRYSLSPSIMGYSLRMKS